MTKIVISSHKKVANCYAANLMSRRHEITISGWRDPRAGSFTPDRAARFATSTRLSLNLFALRALRKDRTGWLGS
jgi:hypothetical protein